LAAYYGSRALGASPLDARLIGTLVCVVRAAYTALKDRRFDPIACFPMLADGVTLAVGLCTRSPEDARGYHRLHMGLTLAVAATQTLHLAAATAVILTLPVDVAKDMLVLLALATDVAVLVIPLGGIGRFLLHHQTSYPRM
jgi:hypothetical protein